MEMRLASFWLTGGARMQSGAAGYDNGVGVGGYEMGTKLLSPPAELVNNLVDFPGIPSVG